MRIVKFSVPNGYQDLDEDKQAKLRAIQIGQPPSSQKHCFSTWQANIEDVLALDMEVILQPVQAEVSDIHQIIGQLKRMEVRLNSLEMPVQTYNERCTVHVPGLGLLMIDEVKVLEDCCTDKLSEHLEGGWRIIAACPQPDQRRPDYVLGRTVTF